MLIPLGTDRPSRSTPVVTPMLMAICAVMFAAEVWMNRDPIEGQPPVEWAMYVGRENFAWWKLVTYAFLHGGVMHLVGNMLFLWCFGPSIEDRLGHWWFLLFYLVGGAAAGLAHLAGESVPALGASGAVAACTGAFLVLFPRTLVRVVVFFIMGGICRIPAVWVIGTAIAWDLTMSVTGRTGVAYPAHLGGYGFGAAVAFALLGFKIIPSEQYDLFTAIKQAKRRAEIRSAVEGSKRDREKNARPIEQTQREMELRARVAAALASGDKAGACDAYRSLAAECNQTGVGVLHRDQQYAVACMLYQAGDFSTAAGALAIFVKAYPKDREVGAVLLMLGTVQAKLGSEEAARATFRRALEELREPALIEMAKGELVRLTSVPK